MAAAAGVMLAPGLGRAAEPDSPALLSAALGCGQAQGTGDAGILLTRARAGGRKPAATRPPEEPVPLLLRAFYVCAGAGPTSVRMGAGWLAVGPVRKG